MSGDALPEPPGLKPPPPPPVAADAAASSTINPLLLGGASPRGGHMDASASVTAILRLALKKAEEEENASKSFEAKIGEVPTSIFPLNRYLQYRRKASSLRALCGRNARHVTVDEIDAIVNTLTLVNALLLTIPFGVLGGLSGSQYWDKALEAMQTRSTTCLSMTGYTISFVEDVFFLDVSSLFGRRLLSHWRHPARNLLLLPAPEEHSRLSTMVGALSLGSDVDRIRHCELHDRLPPAVQSAGHRHVVLHAIRLALRRAQAEGVLQDEHGRRHVCCLWPDRHLNLLNGLVGGRHTGASLTRQGGGGGGDGGRRRVSRRRWQRLWR